HAEPRPVRDPKQGRDLRVDQGVPRARALTLISLREGGRAMTWFRSVAAAVGLVVTIGLGAVALTRAQPPDKGERPGASPRQKLRERLVQLRTEVEVLRLERDAGRAEILDAMKQQRELRWTKGVTEAQADSISKFIVEKKATFAQVVKELNEKQLDLDD